MLNFTGRGRQRQVEKGRGKQRQIEAGEAEEARKVVGNVLSLYISFQAGRGRKRQKQARLER